MEFLSNYKREDTYSNHSQNQLDKSYLKLNKLFGYFPFIPLISINLLNKEINNNKLSLLVNSLNIGNTNPAGLRR